VQPPRVQRYLLAVPPSQFVSAPLERRGASGIDAAGLEPPTGTGVAGTDPGDLPTGWVPERRSEQNVSRAERVGRAPTGVGSVGRARRVFGLAAHGLEGMGSLRANPLLVPSRPERRPRALGAKRPGPSASAARLPHSPGSSSQECLPILRVGDQMLVGSVFEVRLMRGQYLVVTAAET
jgi:hypothetical protein